MTLNRRKFLNSGLMVAGIPLLGVAGSKGGGAADFTGKAKFERQPFYTPNNITPQAWQRYFISHRGVHLKQRIAGENTIESLRLAKRAGFQCVEFDLRFTKDGKAVVIHDETINRTLRDLEGNKLSTPTYVKDLTFEQLRTEYLVHSENKKARVIVPTFEEYLEACRLYQVIPFIEIKEHELSDQQYGHLIGLLDATIGRQNYVVTSNNKVNDKLRRMNYTDVVVMGILYQTTFEHIHSWKNALMAISASRFTAQEMHNHVLEANRQGILTESHADDLDKYNVILRNGIDFISTDALMPEDTGCGYRVEQIDLDSGMFKDVRTNGQIADAQIHLRPGNHLEISLEQYKTIFLYGVTFEIEFSGKLKCRIGEKEHNLQAKAKDYFRYPVLLHKEGFTLNIIAAESCHITGFRLTITRF